MHATASNAFENLTATAVKHLVNYGLTVNPDGVNHAGAPHVFTVQSGAAGQRPTHSQGRAERVPRMGRHRSRHPRHPRGPMPLNSCTTDVNGRCFVTVSSAVTGSGTLTARWGILLDSGQFDLEDSAPQDVGRLGHRHHPRQHKTNLVGIYHQFTVRVRYDAGGGLGLQPLAGVKPAIEMDGVGTVKDTNNPNDCNDQGTSASAPAR